MTLWSRLLSKIKRAVSRKNVRYLLYFIYGILALATIYHVAFARRIIPGVRIGNVRVGGMTYLQAKKALEAYANTVQKEVVLKNTNSEGVTREFRVKDTDIGLVYDWDDSVSRAFEVGRTGNFFIDNKDKLAGFVRGLYLPAFYDYEDTLLGNKLSFIKAEVNVDGVNAGVSFSSDGTMVTTPSKEGIKVIEDSLQVAVLSSFDRVLFVEKTLPVKNVKPKILESDINGALSEIQKIVFNQITIKGKNKSWVVTKDQMLDFLHITKNSKIEFSIDEPKYEAFAASIAKDVNKLPRGQVVSVDGNRVVEFKLARDGEELDKKEFDKRFRDAYFGHKNVIDLPLLAVSGPGDKEKYGILALLGEGSSTFAGSMASRVHNLTLAGERTSGVLVPPGTIYSFNNSVGDIEISTGYDVAYIIKEGRTVLGTGGGVCQTSTTLFRAVLASGLPVIQRNAHAYRVSYYEQDRPVGFDAAVFQPTWDFQFKNDTPNYVLVQFYYEPKASRATFKIFGTPDGRSVEISNPVITNQIAPPAALYQDDPSLAKGVVKQVDWSAWGATVKFNRTIKKDGKVIAEDTFTSRYQPWRAIFLVGTKE